ncbi:unnamed protein product [Gemmataceae bacterium]|nr:unnamed protein product [Gemmataceae bacterium]VTU00760.1 unnamed protein product [Gemmataceae bacterium]
MFIVWGELNVEKRLGVAADKCPLCSRVSLVNVVGVYRKQHIYYIPLGSGTLAATVLTCQDCGGKMTCATHPYSRLLPHSQAGAMHVGEVLEQTNPSQAKAIVSRMQLEDRARAGHPVAPGEPDARLQLAFVRLAELNPSDPEVIALRTRLSQWGMQDAETNTRTLLDLDSLIHQYESSHAVNNVVGLLAQRFKPEPDGCLAFLAFLITAIAGIVAVVEWLDTADLMFAIPAALVTAAVVAFGVHAAWRRKNHKWFFQAVFLPEVKRRGMAVGDVVSRLRPLSPRDERLDPNLRGLIRALPLLDEVLAEQAREQTPPEQHTS